MGGVNKRKISLLPVFVALLVALLAVLAVLQYRWQGQIGEAERERMQVTLRAAANRFSEDFDRELADAYFGLQMNDSVLKNKNWAEYARRFDAWAASASHPGIVKNVWLLQLDSNDMFRLSKFNRSARTFEPQTGQSSAELIDLSGHLKVQLKGALSSDSRQPVNPFLPPIIEPVPALVAPVLPALPEVLPQDSDSIISRRQVVSDYLVITLNLAEIKQNLFQTLASRYFGGAGSGMEYNFAILKKDDPDKVIYKSEANSDSRELFEANDAAVDFFKIRLFGAGSLISETSSRTRPPDSALPAPDALPKQMMLPAPVLGSNQITVRPVSPGEQGGIWLLAVKHRGGSLDTVVEAARRRNLAISFGVLGLLGASAAMIVLTAKRAQRLARQQTEFAANVSHELRTPLSVISLAGENLADGIVDVSPEARNYGALIKEEAYRLTKTIEQVLELSAGQAGKSYELKPLEIPAVIDGALAACGPQIEENNFQILRKVPENLPPVLGNEAALVRAIHNLLTNAMKYSAESRSIKLSVHSVTNKTGNEVVIAVEDEGIGIEPDELDEIFEPFCRGSEAIEKQIHGTGLGLTLVKRIVKSHGGRISVQSAPGCGSIFSVFLPVQKIPATSDSGFQTTYGKTNFID